MKNINVKESSRGNNALLKNDATNLHHKRNGYGGWANLYVFYAVSLLYYMGLLTIKDERYGKTRLGIPNHLTKVIFWEYFERKLRDKYNINYDTEELAKSIWHSRNLSLLSVFNPNKLSFNII